MPLRMPGANILAGDAAFAEMPKSYADTRSK